MNAPPNALRSTTRHLRHVGLGERVHELGAVADHAALLLARAGHEARGVHEHDERQPEGVAGAHEARGLGAGVGVEHAAEVARLVGDDADGAALEAGEPAHDVARPARRPLEQAAAVDDALDDVAHVVDAALVVGHGRRTGRACSARPSGSAAGGRRSWPAGGRAGRARASPRARRTGTTKWATPLRSWTLGPPSSAALTSSPITSRTTPGPVRNIVARSVITTKSVSAGE